MTTGRASRRRPVTKAITGTALVLFTLLAPADSPELPEVLAGLAGSGRAAAQTGVVAGEPSPCPDSPDGWKVDDDDEQLCRIEVPACPFNPYDDTEQPTELMQPDTDYPEFCRTITVTAAADPELHGRCLNLIRQAYVVLDEGTVGCTALQFRSCTVGTRVGPQLCQATSRRMWTCEQGVPRNEFNTCYVAPDAPTSSIPVCEQGAPSFVALDCETYVGTDFSVDAAAQRCEDYDTGGSSPMTEASNRYWCGYKLSDLDPQCHRSDDSRPQRCSSDDTALCLKRQSRTGGCRATASTIVCNEMREIYRSTAESLSENPTRTERQDLADAEATARNFSCEPCLVLPFTPVLKHCPAEHGEEPAYNVGNLHEIWASQEIALAHRIHFRHTSEACAGATTVSVPDACKRLDPVCETPSAGNTQWSSTHFSGTAVVNAGVLVRLSEVPTKTRNSLPPDRFKWDRDELKTDADWKGLVRAYALFPGTPGILDEYLVRTQQRKSFNINSEISEVFRHGNLAYECIVRNLPAFRLYVKELWPDDGPDYGIDADGRCTVAPGDERPNSDAEAIRRLIGQDSLGWWCSLTLDDRGRITLSRGLEFLPDLTGADLVNAREARADTLTTAVDCNVEQGTEVWCRWTPSRSGYFQMAVGGAWTMNSRDSRAWVPIGELRDERAKVRGLTDEDKTRILRVLGQVGCGQGRPVEASCSFSPGVLGLNSNMTDLLPTGPKGDWNERDQDWLWKLSGDGHRFGGSDVRVEFSDGPDTTMYTETQSFGIQVHEVRVNTVTPSR